MVCSLLRPLYIARSGVQGGATHHGANLHFYYMQKTNSGNYIAAHTRYRACSEGEKLLVTYWCQKNLKQFVCLDFMQSLKTLSLPFQ